MVLYLLSIVVDSDTTNLRGGYKCYLVCTICRYAQSSTLTNHIVRWLN